MTPIMVTVLDTFNSLVGEMCEFSDTKAFTDKPRRLVGMSIKASHYFLCERGHTWKHVRKYEAPKPRIKLWTAKTAPDNLMIRQSSWVEGAYCNADVGRTGVIIHVFSEIAMESHAKTITWQELSDDYEQRDGSPCHDVEQVST